MKNEEYSGDSILQAKMMADTVKQNIEADLNEVWGSEVNLCYPQLYAGTTDLVGVYKGEPHIMDFKQTNKPKKREWIDDYFMQALHMVWSQRSIPKQKLTERQFLCAVENASSNRRSWT